MKKYCMFRNTACGRGLVWAMVLIMFIFPVMPVWALPRGESVVHGNVSFATSGGQMVVNQGTSQAIVNYQGFDIAGGESVQFVQPGSSAAILNRVTGAGSSTIAGQMSANGRVFLVNRNSQFW
jgi:large exoprotein involved in heme utilization and adhesion